MIGARRRVLNALSNVAVLAAAIEFGLGVAHASSGWAPQALIDTTPTVCLWVRAQYVTPGSSHDIDVNAFGYKESSTSCNFAAPWSSSFNTGEIAINAQLFTSDYAYLCTTTNDYGAPGGHSIPLSIGIGYNRVGQCAATTYYVDDAYGYISGALGGTAHHSQVNFTYTGK